MDKKVVIGIAMILLLVGAIIVAYGGTQIVSPEEKVVDASTEKTALGESLEAAKAVYEGSKSGFKAPGLPTLPEGGNEVILGIVLIVGGIMLYVKKDKIIK